MKWKVIGSIILVAIVLFVAIVVNHTPEGEEGTDTQVEVQQ